MNLKLFTYPESEVKVNAQHSSQTLEAICLMT